MILEIQQFSNGANLSYKCYRNGQAICDVISPFENNQRYFYFNFTQKQKKMEMRYTPGDKSFGKDFQTRHIKRIYDDQELIGSIVNRKEYGAFDVDYRGRKFLVYNVEYAGVCCQVVLDEKECVVAEIKRYLKPRNYKDHYTAFSDMEELEALLCMLAVNIDFVEYRENGGDLLVTHGCPGAEKYYDEEFIKRIAIQEGYDLNQEPEAPVQPPVWDIPKEAQDKKDRHDLFLKIIKGVVLAVFLLMIINMLF